MKPWNYLVVQKKVIDKTENGENVPSLEVVLVQCSAEYNQYQKGLKYYYNNLEVI